MGVTSGVKTGMIGAILAEYRLLEELGGQGGSQVYKAVGFDGRKPVAIKLFPAEIHHDKEKLQSLLDSLRKVARLDQPGIPRLIGSGVSGGRPYVVMPFMTGGSLRDRLEIGNVSPENASDLLTKISEVLDRIHALGVVHGHLSASEVMFDDAGQLQIIGLGQPPLVSNGSNGQGKQAIHEYLAPEVREGAQPTPASDQYSLAVLAFELLSGLRVKEAVKAAADLKAGAGGSVADPGHRQIQLPPKVSEVLQRALDDDPSRRFGSVGEMIRALDSAARTPSLPSRAPGSTPHSEGRIRRSLGWGFASMVVVVFACFALSVPALAAVRWMGFDLTSIAGLLSDQRRVPTVSGTPELLHARLPQPTPNQPGSVVDDPPAAIFPTQDTVGQTDPPSASPPEDSEAPDPVEAASMAPTQDASLPGSASNNPDDATATQAVSSTPDPNNPQQASPTPPPAQPTPTDQPDDSAACRDPSGQTQSCTTTP